MKVLSVSVPVFTSDFEAAIGRYETLTGEAVSERFDLPDRGIRIAILGGLTIIALSEREIDALRDVRATFIVDSLAEFDARRAQPHFRVQARPQPAQT